MCSLFFGLCLEFGDVNDEALVRALAYQAFLIVGSHLEDNPSAVNLNDFAFTPHLSV